MLKFLLPAIAVVLLAGCGHSNTASLTFTPPSVKDCGANTKPAALAVHWDATGAVKKGGTIKLWVNNKPVNQGVFASGGNNGTLWLQGALTGTATTGNWMYPGTRVTMTNAADGDVLAHQDVPGTSCHG